MTSPERQLEDALVAKLRDLKYEHRTDLRDRATLEANFRQKFEALNRVRLTDGEFHRLLDEIVTGDVFNAAAALRTRNSFTRDDGTPLNYTLVNTADWCKNTFEVVNQLRINTDNSHHRYDVLLLINGVPAVQIELKTLGINPRRAIEQIVDYKNDPGNGYTRTLLCFVQLFVVTNRDATYYFANNNARHFAFNADERFLPIYQFAAPDNAKINGLDRFADAFLAKCTLGHTISRYMVLVASEHKLLIVPVVGRGVSHGLVARNALESDAAGGGRGVGRHEHRRHGGDDRRRSGIHQADGEPAGPSRAGDRLGGHAPGEMVRAEHFRRRGPAARPRRHFSAAPRSYRRAGAGVRRASDGRRSLGKVRPAIGLARQSRGHHPTGGVRHLDAQLRPSPS